jgi:hypothetical protein
MRSVRFLLSAALLSPAVLLLSGASSPASAPIYSGCAMRVEDGSNFLTFCESQACSLLSGKVDLHLAGHTIKVQGIVHPATASQPRTIDVETVVEVGGACSEHCKLVPAGRGIGKDHPDSEGGTPGVSQPPSKDQTPH